MKKIISFLLALVMCLSLAIYGGGHAAADTAKTKKNEAAEQKEKAAFEAASSIYTNINIAYEITQKYGNDLSEACLLSFTDEDELVKNGVKFLAKNLNASEEELLEGLVYAVAVDALGEDWEKVSETEKETYRELADTAFGFMGDDLSGLCALIVKGTYRANGDLKEAEAALDAAKAQLKQLKQDYPDYEYYSDLLDYYTATNTFFDFCVEPSGSYLHVMSAVSEYQDEIQKYISALEFAFEE